MDMLLFKLGLRFLPLPDAGSLDSPVRELPLSSPEIKPKNDSFFMLADLRQSRRSP